jgi:hypothetical protein
MATTTQGEAAMNSTDNIYDASINHCVDAAIVLEVTATQILHLASKMPYAADEDALNSYEYLSNRFGFWAFRNVTAIKGPEVLMERSLMIRAAAEIAAASKEMAA